MVLVTAAFEGSVEWIRRDGKGDMFDLVRVALQVSGVLEQLDDFERRQPEASKRST